MSEDAKVYVEFYESPKSQERWNAPIRGGSWRYDEYEDSIEDAISTIQSWRATKNPQCYKTCRITLRSPDGYKLLKVIVGPHTPLPHELLIRNANAMAGTGPALTLEEVEELVNPELLKERRLEEQRKREEEVKSKTDVALNLLSIYE